MQDSDPNTTPVRPGYHFDEARLADWLTANIETYHGPLRVDQFTGGQSNPTYRLTTPERSYVLRRKPLGQLMSGAHAVDREAKVLAALATTGFPVAKLYGLCTDDTVIGTWFYVMEMVEGRIFWNADLPLISAAERPAYFRAMNETVARLHLIDYAAIGLADYGRPGNYFARQISRWTRQYLEDSDAGRDANMDRLVEWLPAHIPAGDETSLVHGDMRIDNIIFHPSEPRVLAVLDWELSTLGHPLADFAYHAMMFRMPPRIVAGLAGADLAQLNIPSEEAYVTEYCRRIGRADMPGYNFYVAFNFFRLAAIFHGIKARVLRGTAASAEAKNRVMVLPGLMELAWQQAMKAGAR
jgi:aminoglycoside phosphotransferase (APT) family kinase protein